MVEMATAIFDYYSNVAMKPVAWFWYPYIPYGKLTIIQGDPGEGKSTFVLNLVARLTRGQNMPDGYEVPEAGVAIYQCAEDGVADTIKPRLEQAGADCTKVAYIVDDDIALTLEDGRIETVIQETKAKVFIIDPIQAFIPPEIDMQSATRMRAVLRKLAQIAEKTSCAMILVGHMNKGSGAKTLYRGLGSIDIAAIARSVLMISRDEQQPELRYMYPIKSSLAAEGSAIAFSFKDGGGLAWHGQYNLNTAALTDSVTIKTSKRDKAKAIILQLLSQGGQPVQKIKKELTDIGVASRTIAKVKSELNIQAYRTDAGWFWRLPMEDEDDEKEL